MFRLPTVIIYGFLECSEGVYRLLKHLDHWYSPDVLGSRLRYPVESSLVFRHDFRVFSSHHGKHRYYRDDCSQYAGCAHSPVKHEHEYKHGYEHHHCSYNVGKVVGKERLRIRRRRIKSSSYQTGCIRIKISQRRLHQAGCPLLSYVGSRSKRRKVSAHEADKIDQYPSHGKSEGYPPVRSHISGFLPVRSHGYKFSCHKPYQNVRRHA